MIKEKEILQGQRKVREAELYFESGKNWKNLFNTADLKISLKAARSAELPQCPARKDSPKANLNNKYPLLTKFFRSRWLDIGLVLFLRVYGPRLRRKKKELGHYPAMEAAECSIGIFEFNVNELVQVNPDNLRAMSALINIFNIQIEHPVNKNRQTLSQFSCSGILNLRHGYSEYHDNDLKEIFSSKPSVTWYKSTNQKIGIRTVYDSWIIINNCYIARLSLNNTSTVIGWFLVTCPWSNSNVSLPGYRPIAWLLSARRIQQHVLCLFFAVWLFN